jgi:hypothetical protein
MVKAVLGDVRLRTAGRPLELDVHQATHLACIKGHTALVRHLFEKYSLTLITTPAHQTSAVATTYADDNVLRRSKILTNGYSTKILNRVLVECATAMSLHSLLRTGTVL